MHRVVHELVQWPFLVILSTSVLLALVVPPGVIRALPGLDGILDGVIQLPWNESRVALALAGYVVAGGGFFIGLTMLALGFRALLATRRAAP